MIGIWYLHSSLVHLELRREEKIKREEKEKKNLEQSIGRVERRRKSLIPRLDLIPFLHSTRLKATSRLFDQHRESHDLASTNTWDDWGCVGPQDEDKEVNRCSGPLGRSPFQSLIETTPKCKSCHQSKQELRWRITNTKHIQVCCFMVCSCSLFTFSTIGLRFPYVCSKPWRKTNLFSMLAFSRRQYPKRLTSDTVPSCVNDGWGSRSRAQQ